jgi:hypothetical protein
LNLLKRFEIDKSPGPDGSHPRVLKECASELAHPLTAITKASVYRNGNKRKWLEATEEEWTK